MKSFRKSHGCLLAVAAAAAGAGVWSELQAAAIRPPQVVSRSITAASPDWSTFVDIYENGDGTAFTVLFMFLGENEFIGSLDWATPTYNVSTSFQPGQSGLGAGTATGAFSREVVSFDMNTWELTGVFMATVDISVANAAEVVAFVRQGVTSQGDPLTGEIRIARENIIGNQAWGYAAGSLSVRLDGNLVAQSTGGYGQTQVNTTHTIQRIH